MLPYSAGMMQGGGEKTYASMLAAIPNKRLLYRADLSTALDTSPLSSAAWTNEGSLGGSAAGSATWETNSLNGFRGVLANASGESATTGKTVDDVLGVGNKQFTAFAVESRSGTQGAGVGTSRRNNSTVIGDNGWGLTFEAASKEFTYYTIDTAYVYQPSGLSFANSIPYVLAWRMSATGNLRFNFNGTIASFATAVGTPPSLSSPIPLNRWTAGTNRGFEYLVTPDVMADADIDAFAIALRTKWGI